MGGMGILAWALIGAAALSAGGAAVAAVGTDLLDEAEWSAAPLTRALDAELETDDVAADVRREQTA